MAANDYGFSEDLIVETKVIDKDKHGFVRVTNTTGGNANNNGLLKSFVEWDPSSGDHFWFNIVINADDELFNPENCIVRIGVTSFETMHDSMPSKGDPFSEEAYSSTYGLDAYGTIETHVLSTGHIVSLNDHIYTLHDLYIQSNNPTIVTRSIYSLLENEDIHLTTVNIDEEYRYYKFDLNVVVTREVNNEEVFEFVDIIHCRTPIYGDEEDDDGGK